MAGYLFTFNDVASLFDSIRRGSYATLMNPKWSGPVASTLADYATMRPGDSVYFFSRRRVYGLGEIVSIVPNAAAIENYPGATNPTSADYATIELNTVVDHPVVRVDGGDRVKRWLIVFKPAPYFFTNGIDMDDLLASDDRAFRSLRVFWQRSFIKLDDQEDAAFKAALLRRNVNALYSPTEKNTIACDYERTLSDYRARLDGRECKLDIPGLLSRARKSTGSLSSEMMLEVGLLHQLMIEDPATVDIFGRWDYLSHQVHASPMKAVDYMDKIDVFAYRWIEGFKPIVEAYAVFELKKDKATGDDLQQVMKYVDWVNREYANGDYSLLRAFLVARDFDMQSIAVSLETIERNYIVDCRPPSAKTWSKVDFVSYSVDETGYISFSRVVPLL